MVEPIYIVLVILAIGLFYIDKLLKKKYEMPRGIELLYFANRTHRYLFFIYAFSSIAALFAAQVEVERMGRTMSLIWIDPITLLAVILFIYCAMRSYFVKKVDNNIKEAKYFSAWGIVSLIYGMIIFGVDLFFM